MSNITTTGLVEALGWLQNSSPKQDLIVQALEQGLLRLDEGNRWHADTEHLSALLELQNSTFPDDLAAIAPILYGLGEMAARSHANCFGVVKKHLISTDLTDQWSIILDFAVQLRKPQKKSTSKTIISTSQSFTSTQFDWDGVYLAVRHVLYTQEHFSHPHYGFAFIVRLALNLAPKELSNWVSTQGSNDYLPVVLGQVLKEIQFYDKRDFADGLIKGANPFLKCLGCAALVTPNWRTEKNFIPLAAQCKHLIALGVKSSDAIWVSSFLLKEALHSWHRTTSNIDQTAARLEYIKQHPEAASGGGEYAQYEIERLEQSLSETRPQYEKNNLYIEKCLNDLAKHWPKNGLSDVQLGYLEQSFVSPMKIRFQLAVKLNHTDNRFSLLTRNIDSVIEYLGSENPDWRTEHFYYDPSRDDDRLQWAAKSHAYLWGDDPQQFVKRLGRRIKKLTDDANSLIHQPFCDVRKPTEWQSAIEQLATIHLFVLWSIESVSAEKRGNIQQLLFPHVSKHITHLLAMTKDQWNDRGMYIRDRLIQTFIWFVTHDSSLHATRDNWVFDNPPVSLYAKAMAVWSESTVTSVYKQIAIDLFQQLGQLPMGDTLNNRVFNELINLLDLAMHTAFAGKDNLLGLEIIRIWETSLEEWPENVSNEWLNHASFIFRAMFEDGNERTEFLKETKFKQTYCAQALNKITSK